MSAGVLAGSPNDVRRRLAAAPVTDKRLSELHVEWARLPPALDWMAEVLRLVLLT